MSVTANNIIILLTLMRHQHTAWACLCFLLLGLVKAQNIKFDYSDHGQSWAKDCNDPKAVHQSPIILPLGITTKNNSYLFCEFEPVDSTIYFYNTTIYVKSPAISNPFGTLYTKTIEGTTVPWIVYEMRIRAHSEHRVQDQAGFYDVELQIFGRELYSSSQNYKIALGLFFEVKEGSSDPFLQTILDSWKEGQPKVSAAVDLRHLLPRQYTGDFWTYLGSPTIPPCSDSKINWFVLRKVYPMSQQQRDFIFKMFNDPEKGKVGNWRQVQSTQANPVAFSEFSTLEN